MIDIEGNIDVPINIVGNSIPQGKDGFSPIANVSKSGNVATITITDKNGTTTANISDGINGTNGKDGKDGFSPIANVVKVGDTATITITDEIGTTTTTITDGINGNDGKDGVDGYTPQRTIDYWTNEDIATIQAYIDSKTTGLLSQSY